MIFSAARAHTAPVEGPAAQQEEFVGERVASVLTFCICVGRGPRGGGGDLAGVPTVRQ